MDCSASISLYHIVSGSVCSSYECVIFPMTNLFIKVYSIVIKIHLEPCLTNKISSQERLILTKFHWVSSQILLGWVTKEGHNTS